MTRNSSSVFPIRLASPSGLSVELNSNGSIRRMDHGDIMLNLFLGNEADGGLANIYLRRLGESVETIPLLGPGSPASYEIDERGFSPVGSGGPFHFRVRSSWRNRRPRGSGMWNWRTREIPPSLAISSIPRISGSLITVRSGSTNTMSASMWTTPPLEHPNRGRAVASRQNQSMGGRCPWTVIGSLGRGVAYATDALQFHGLATRAGETPVALTSGLPGKRLQHEHSMVSIQDDLSC